MREGQGVPRTVCEWKRNTGPLRVLCGITGQEYTFVLGSEAATGRKPGSERSDKAEQLRH